METKQEYQITKQVVGREVSPMVVDMLFTKIAPVMGRAHGLSVDKTSAILLKGYELGLSITASLELVQTVQGKTSLSPRGALALIQNSPAIKEVKLTRLVDAKGAFTGYECYIERTSGFNFTARWTMEQAAKAGLVKDGSGWASYPENMCMYRAIGFAADVAASDVTCGLTAFLKMPEQYDLGIDDGGNVIDAKSVTVINPGVNVPAEVERLCNEYGLEAVMIASEGVIPVTSEDCQRLESMLKEGVGHE
jgi:hypothetical protein